MKKIKQNHVAALILFFSSSAILLFVSYQTFYFLASTTAWPSSPPGELGGGKILNLIYPDIANQRVGIGTDSPQGKLDVVGTGMRTILTAASVDGDGSNGCTAGKEKVFLDTAGIAVGYKIDEETISYVTPPNSTSKYICTNDSGISWLAGEEKWWLNPNSVFTVGASGHIGVGTYNLNPNLAITANGPIGASQYCDASNQNCIAAAELGADTVGDLNCLNGEVPTWNGTVWGCGSGGGDWDFNGGDTTISGGHVGIGTTDPTAQLHIVGNLNTALTGTISVGAGSAAVVGTGTQFLTEIKAGDAIKIGNEMFTVLTVVDNTHLTLDSVSVAGAAGGTKAYADSTLFAVDNGDQKNYFIIDKSGNIGIGTSTPSAKLDVVGTTELNGNAQVNGNLGVSGLTNLGDTLTVAGNLDTALTGTISVGAGSTAVVGTGTQFVTEIRAGDAIKIGNEVFTVVTVIDNTHLTLDSVSVAGAAGGTKAYADSVYLFYINSGDGQQLVTINRSGDIITKGNLGAVRYCDENNQNCKTFTELVNQGKWDTATGGINYAGGNVGIGTATPSAKLDVAAGDVSFDSGAFAYTAATNTTSADRLKTGSLRFEEDAGTVSWSDLPVSDMPNSGTVESYSAQIDNTPILTVYAEADSNGGVTNTRIGIGTTSPSAKLDVNGTTELNGNVDVLTGDLLVRTAGRKLGAPQYCDGSGNNCVNQSVIAGLSDARLKENIIPVEGLGKIRELNGVRFNWKNTGAPGIGFIAQEVESIFPELVSTADDALGTKSVQYTGLIAPLTEAVKELDRQNQELKQQNNALQERISSLEKIVMPLLPVN